MVNKISFEFYQLSLYKMNTCAKGKCTILYNIISVTYSIIFENRACVSFLKLIRKRNKLKFILTISFRYNVTV